MVLICRQHPHFMEKFLKPRIAETPGLRHIQIRLPTLVKWTFSTTSTELSAAKAGCMRVRF